MSRVLVIAGCGYAGAEIIAGTLIAKGFSIEEQNESVVVKVPADFNGTIENVYIRAYPLDSKSSGLFKKEKTWDDSRKKSNYKSKRRSSHG